MAITLKTLLSVERIVCGGPVPFTTAEIDELLAEFAYERIGRIAREDCANERERVVQVKVHDLTDDVVIRVALVGLGTSAELRAIEEAAASAAA